MRKARKQLRLTQKEVSEALGVSTNHYATIERGENPATKGLALDFCTVYRIRPDWLLDGVGDLRMPLRERYLVDRSHVMGEKEVFRVAETMAEYGSTSTWEDRLREIIETERDLINAAVGKLGVSLADVLAGIGRRIEKEQAQNQHPSPPADPPPSRPRHAGTGVSTGRIPRPV